MTSPPPDTTGRIMRRETGVFQVSRAPAPHDGADHSRVKQPVLIPIGSRDHVSLIRLAASLNIDTQDRQDKQDEKLVHKKLIGSIIECAFVENLSVLRGPSRIPFESFPTPWNPFADSSFALLTDPLSPLVEIFSPFPTFGGSLLSSLQPLSGPSSSFVALRGFLFLAFVDNPQLFQASVTPSPDRFRSGRPYPNDRR